MNFFDIIFLSKNSNRILCNNCGTVLELSKSSLNAYGGITTGIFLLIVKFGERMFQFNSRFTVILVSIAWLVCISLFFYFKTKPTISKNQDKKELVTEEIKRPILPENPTRTEYLKNKFYDKSNSELESIFIDSKRVPEAQQAAKELLEERNKVT